MTSATERLTAALADRYRIERELGAGGMATVYLAHDLRHDREVAIKVLHPDLGAALGGERFLSEIKTTARLQHPHILPLLDSGAADGLLYYVMPHVSGETLRARLERERQLPLGDALRIAREVADALGHAHGLGIIHRDIKPENILLQGGHALVADFGIALAVQQAGGARMTQTGLSLGTPQYMSPEQAMGERTIDARSDVYALGAVTYEMLTGDPPFTGSTVQAIVARVLTERPAPPSTVRDTVPAAVEQAVLRALAKLPADRFASPADFVAAFDREPSQVSIARPAVAGASRTTYALGALSLVFAVAAAWALWRLWGRPASTVTDTPSYETTIVFPDSTPLAYIGAVPLGVGLPAFTVSPDGTVLVYVGQAGTTTRLYRRALGNSAIEPLPGTEGAYAPFFSPDSKSVGFFAGGSVRRVPVGGGAPVTIAEVVLPYGGVWLPDGRIIVAADEGDRLIAIPAAGGAASNFGPKSTAWSLVLPELLPDGRTILLTTQDHNIAVVSVDSGWIRLLGPQGAVDADSITESTPLLSGSHARYVAPGHLLYHSLDGAVMALPFDALSQRVLGEPTPVLSGARLESIWGAGQLTVTRDGTLIFARGENGRRTSLVWLDARGKVDTLTAFGREDFGALDLSPDGSRLIMRSCAQAGCGIQILSLREGVRVPFSSRGISRDASWATFGWDGSQRVFASGRQTGRLRRRGRGEVSNAFSPDVDAAPDSLLGVTVLDVARDGAVLFLRDSALHVAGSWAAVRDDTLPSGIRIAEDAPWGFQLRAGGDWVAYTARSEQAGQYVVYMARTRPPYERWRASPRGGEEPVWDREGNLVYREGNRWMRVAPPTTVGQRPGVATMLFEGQYLNVLGRSHDIAPDGRHLLIAGPHDTTTTSLTVVTRWAQRLPAGGLARK